MASMGMFEQSDLSKPWAWRRAMVWIAVAAALAVASLVDAIGSGRWYELLFSLFFAVSAGRTGQRLARHRAGRV